MSNPDCPNCGNELEAGALLDCITGQRGYDCDNCDMAYPFSRF
jgi:predicted RNA-binding Zn-ribbon protein involved in translation (DUF1610 family)